MINLLLHIVQGTLTVLAVGIIYFLLVWLLAMCVGFNDRDDSWP